MTRSPDRPDSARPAPAPTRVAPDAGARTTDAAWDPRQYAVFSGHRGRPFADLVARVDATAPALVVDLGCGPGELTLRSRGALARRTRRRGRQLARDARARPSPGQCGSRRVGRGERRGLGPHRVSVRRSTCSSRTPRCSGCRRHLRLIPTWVQSLAPGGTFAMQVPSELRRAVPPAHARGGGPALPRSRPRARPRPCPSRRPPETYAALLLDLTPDVDVWQTTYQHVLPRTPTAPHPVLEWVRGTGLRPVLGLLDDDERERFVTDYERARHGIPPKVVRRALPLHPDLRRRAHPALTPSVRVACRRGRVPARRAGRAPGPADDVGA